METYCMNCKKVLEKLNKIYQCFFEMVLLVARENEFFGKIKN